MKGITCCGDCGYYNLKKHKCSRAKNEGKPQYPFYVDCPLPDAAPVLHGRWVKSEQHGYKCSMCNCMSSIFDDYLQPTFCPWCGTKMDGKDDAENG